MEDEDRTKDITLGALTGFFGFYDDKTSKYYFRNKDLLEAGITDDTFKFLKEL